MPGKAVGRAAADLPWLCPDANSLIVLAERPESLAGASLSDPALLAFLLRYGIAQDQWQSPTLPDAAATYLQRVRGAWRNPTHPFNLRLDQFAARSADFAAELARTTGRASAREAAWAARLAPLGWLAVSAIEADAAARCRGHERFSDDPAGIQRERWGLDHDAIARRLAARWKLPERIGAIIGQLSLPFGAVRFAVPDADLFAVVALAVREVERRHGSLALTRSDGAEELLAHLQLTDAHLQALQSEAPSSRQAADPQSVPLLPNLLRMAADSRRRNGATLVLRLEEKVDRLQSALSSMAGNAGERIHEARLRGLAELAAGAGHEINNPLMVIAGHAQRLRQKETDPEREGVLRTIERQTERIASLIKGLMQFARPARPNRQRWPAAELLQAVRDDLLVEADLRGIALTAERPDADLWVEADREQVRQALRAVVRNGIEAAEEGGWVRVSVDAENASVSFVVEDSGPGISGEQSELMFDPFFCGRPAGRGRGLGLSIAWRLAEQNGGSLKLEAQSPTRFRLTLPRTVEQVERMSA